MSPWTNVSLDKCLLGQMSPGTTVPWTYEILAYNTWKIKVNFIVSDPETVIMDQFLAPEKVISGSRN